MDIIEIRLADVEYTQTMVFDLLTSTMNAIKKGDNVVIITGNEKISVEVTKQ